MTYSRLQWLGCVPPSDEDELEQYREFSREWIRLQNPGISDAEVEESVARAWAGLTFEATAARATL